MSSIVENYIPEEGIIVYSDNAIQRITSIYNGGFNYRSRIMSDILPTGKNSFDSCWETGNIYFISNGDVHKVKYNGDSIVSLPLANAVSLSVSQAILPMSEEPIAFREDNGCWIVKNTNKELVKTDKDLNVLSTLKYLSDPKLVISSDFDGGCYLFDDGAQWVAKINSYGVITSYILYSGISSSLTSASVISRAKVDHTGNLWILINKTIYKVTLLNDTLTITKVLNPLDSLGLTIYNSTVSDFDIDRNSTSANLYVTGGCKNKVWILKYNLNGVIIASETDIEIDHPVAIQVTQYYGSTGIYIITESDLQYLPFECYSSSSSEGYSSSSSSSSITSSSSSSSLTSSSSSSSFEEICCDRWAINFHDPSLDYIFPNWDIYGLTGNITENCRLWAEVLSISINVQQINIYKSPIKSSANLIAYGSTSSYVSGNITLYELNGSGVSGTVEWYEIGSGQIYHPYIVNYLNSLYELNCIESSSSSSS